MSCDEEKPRDEAWLKKAIEALSPEKKPRTHTVKIIPATVNGVKGYFVGGNFCEEMVLPDNFYDEAVKKMTEEIDREIIEEIRKLADEKTLG